MYNNVDFCFLKLSACSL